MDLSLMVLQGKPQGKELPIHVSPFIIGRGPECHLRPNSDMVSRRHCALIVHGHEVHIRDLGSTNGTIVDGERLTGDLKLSDGDIFQVGPLVFQVVIRDVAAADRPEGTHGALPAGATSEGVANHAASADEIMQWLVSDSKNEIPTSGSGVYSGKTVFTTIDHEKTSTTPDTTNAGPPGDVVQPAMTEEAKAGTKPHHSGHKPDDHAHKPVETPGAAAHAAEDMLHQFLHRRPHK